MSADPWKLAGPLEHCEIRSVVVRVLAWQLSLTLAIVRAVAELPERPKLPDLGALSLTQFMATRSAAEAAVDASRNVQVQRMLKAQEAVAAKERLERERKQAERDEELKIARDQLTAAVESSRLTQHQLDAALESAQTDKRALRIAMITLGVSIIALVVSIAVLVLTIATS